MARLTAFEFVSIDGYFADRNGDMSFAKASPDPEFEAYMSENAKGGGRLVFGRLTYAMMAAWWPTPAAAAGWEAWEGWAAWAAGRWISNLVAIKKSPSHRGAASRDAAPRSIPSEGSSRDGDKHPADHGG